MAERIVRLSFPAKADYLLLARLALSGLARDLPLDDELVADLKLAITEACGNAVRHAYPSTEGSVVVVYEIDDSRLQMTVEDRGQGIVVRDSVEDHAEALTPLESGMGMPIIRAIVDELVVEQGPAGQGTVVRMVKFLDSAA